MKAIIAKGAALVVLFLVLLTAGSVEAQSGGAIDSVRDGTVYVRSSGSGSLTVSWSGSLWDVWDSRYFLRDPSGNTISDRTISSSSGAGSASYSLSLSGDYILSFPLQFRRYSVSSQNLMVIETNKRKATFRASAAGQTFGRYYFQVPSGSSSFVIHGFASRGGDNNTLRLYSPNGSLHTSFSVPNNQLDWPSRTINSPAGGMWSVEMQTESSDAEISFWVENVPNYFATSSSSWFQPNLQRGNVNINVDATNIVGPRGLIGTGRIAETGSLSSLVRSAFLDIGLEANEVALNHTYREPSNDNSDPNNLNLAGFDFSNQAVDLTVNQLNAAPVIHIDSPASWLSSTGSSGLSSTSTHAEWAEAVLGVVTHYATVAGYPIKYMGISDEPNLDPIPASAFAQLFGAANSRLRASGDTRINSVYLYPGSVTTLDNNGLAYLNYLIDNLDPNSWRFLGFHPWQMGYPGYGNVFSTKVVAEQINSLMQRADSRGGGQKKVLISEVNAKFGDSTNQDIEYFDSWGQGIWWSSLLASVISTGRNEAILYYPFAESEPGTSGYIHNIRGMVRPDGTLKPVAYATKFVMSHILANVAGVSSQSWEVDSLATVDGSRERVNVILTNKEKRSQDVSINLQVPTGVGGVSWTAYKVNSGNYANPSQAAQSQAGVDGGVAIININSMDPESIYSIDVDFGPSGASCTGDVDGNGIVNIGDLAGVLYYWGQTCSQNPASCTADVNNNGRVEIGDISGVLYYWGGCN